MSDLNKNISMYDEVIITSFSKPEHHTSIRNTYKIKNKLCSKKDKYSETIFQTC